MIVEMAAYLPHMVERVLHGENFFISGALIVPKKLIGAGWTFNFETVLGLLCTILLFLVLFGLGFYMANVGSKAMFGVNLREHLKFSLNKGAK
jgi:hypothetical protein